MPALRPRRGSPGPSRKPKAGGPQRERPNPRNRNERKTETKSKRKEKQRQKQIKNKTGPKPKRKKRRRRSNPAAAAPRSHLTRAPPKRAANPKIRPQPTPPSQAKPKQGQAKARPSRSKAKPKPAPGQQDRRPGVKKTKTALDPAADADAPRNGARLRRKEIVRRNSNRHSNMRGSQLLGAGRVCPVAPANRDLL